MGTKLEVAVVKTYLIDFPEYDDYWPHWRTTGVDHEWEQLMGMSWETVDPPEELKQRFKDWLDEGSH